MIFLFLLVATCLPFSSLLLDFNLALRFFLFHALAVLLLLFLPSIKLERSSLWLVAYFGFTLLSALWSLSPSETLLDAGRVLAGIVVFLSTRTLLQMGHERFLAQSLLFVCSLVLLVNALGYAAEYFFEVPFATTSAHPNLLSSCLFLFLPLIWHFRKLEGNRWMRTSLLFVVLIVVFLIALQTRSVWIALLVFGSLILIHRFWANSRWLLLSGVVAVFVLSAILVIGSAEEWLNIVSVQERMFVWKKTLLLIADHPLFGIGGGNWSLNYAAYGLEGFDTLEVYGLRMQRPHNDFLWVLAEGGAVGFALLSGFFAQLALKWWKSENPNNRFILAAGTVAFLTVSMFSFPRERMEHIVLLFVLLALLDHTIKRGQKASGLSLKIPLLLLCGAAAVVGAFRLRGDFFARQLLDAVNEQRHEQVLELAQKAQSPFYQLVSGDTPIASYSAQAHLQLGNEAEFVAESEKAFLQAPNNYEVANNYGMSLNAQKRYDEALNVLLAAHQINPRFDGIIFNLAIVHYNLQDYQAAKTWIDRVHLKSELTDQYSGIIHRKLGIGL